ncbi:cell division protein FtsB [Deefgea salmonis]|uniref:Cell division protein FtsB n=1 Tax=Deefgea salmonis TaxID=2875502 RepID=A0ABS8BGV9_9NEIS|nr:cell division protein FtsB [Deefgea salmonis]MCB5194957.1 cell division protein FtsB [Deefgea salmonis]
MRILAIFFAIVIAALQWPLWVGKGSWLRVWQLDSQLSQHRESNTKLKERNEALEAEVQDLKNGTDAIEERARNELGMIRQGEVFFQVLDQSPVNISAIKPSISNTAASKSSTKAY